MAIVEPIRSRDKVYELLHKLEEKSDRDALLFHLGINTGLRSSDLVRLKFEDIFENGEIKKHLDIKQKKTHKFQRIIINNLVKDRIREYAREWDMRNGDWFFPSYRRPEKHITTQQVWRRMKPVAQSIGIRNFGTHTMRKTFGLSIYNKTKDPVQVMRALGQTDIRTTLSYIGITQATLDSVIQDGGF